MHLPILYMDDTLVAINKPNGLLTHRTKMAAEADIFALQLLRDQLGGEHLYPLHRLDRPTSGILLFARSAETVRPWSEALHDPSAEKHYTALVRGHLFEPIRLTREVRNERGNPIAADTSITPLRHLTLPLEIDKYPTSRFTLVDCLLHSGRWHQIRQHLAQQRHYIINDRVHGNNKYNRYFKQTLSIEPLFLHARFATLKHPFNPTHRIEIEAPFPQHWQQLEEIR